MALQDYMTILENMGAAVFATVDSEGKPRTRFANVGVANENGIFFIEECFHIFGVKKHTADIEIALERVDCFKESVCFKSENFKLIYIFKENVFFK